VLTEPSTSPATARRLAAASLRGETQPIQVRLSSHLVGDEIEVAGSAPIDFADFRIEPPSVAGFVTVEDQGTLEFKLRLAPR
jgi:hypothetical protein